MRFQSLLPIFFLPLFIGCGGDQAVGNPTTSHPGAAIYLRYCASCHGIDMKSGSGGTLVGSDLKHGEDIRKTISMGIPKMGMPDYGRTIKGQQMDDLVAYIQQAREKGAADAAPAPVVKNLKSLTTLDYEVAVDLWVSGLDIPWSLKFIDERRALVTERRGTLRWIIDGQLMPQSIQGTPKVLHEGQGGLLDVAIDPEFESNELVYLSYSHLGSGGNAMTRIVRGRIDGDQWIEDKVVYEAPANTYSQQRHHYGSRTVFDREGRLYFSVGDRGMQNQAQQLDRPNGKIHRINRDGTIPPDNPFVQQAGALPSIWSYGHRNPQGLAFHPGTGELWDAEHGPRGGDEINLVQKGLNYGWPVITYGINYNGSIITRDRVREGMEQPIWYWRPSTGLCAITFYTGAEFPFWENNLLAGALANQDLRLLKIENNRVIHEEVILSGMGRIRDVTVGPEGAIYLTLNDPHQIIRLTAKGETKY